MSERLTSHETHENHAAQAEQHEAPRSQEVDHRALEEQQKNQLEASRQSAEKEAAPSRLLAIEKDEPTNKHDVASHSLLKKDSYKSILKQTRQNLSKPARAFSRLVHQASIETISNVGAQTVARPSGLLGGGLGALAGSLTLLYYAKHYGFRYNYAFFLITFVVGFGIGLIVELVARIFKRQTDS